MLRNTVSQEEHASIGVLFPIRNTASQEEHASIGVLFPHKEHSIPRGTCVHWRVVSKKNIRSFP